MRVRFVKHASLDSGTYRIGEVHDLPTPLAKRLAEADAVEPLEEDAAKSKQSAKGSS